eukprot:16446221-Heterocapsa_arctica.AAC.1
MAGLGPGLGAVNCVLRFLLKNRLGSLDVIIALDRGRAVHADLIRGVDTRAAENYTSAKGRLEVLIEQFHEVAAGRRMIAMELGDAKA